MAQYSIQKIISGSFEEVLKKTKDSLSQEGFGVLTEIDVSETLKKKLGVEYPNYVILGACNPQSAYKALQAEKEIGLLLPCNVIVYEDQGNVIISAIRPTIAMEMIKNKNIATLAQEVEVKLERVIHLLTNNGDKNAK